jgi:polyisoprenoid-binding protein YceI
VKQQAITHLVAGLALCTALSARAAVEVYTIDPDHSWVGFSVRHIFTKVPGFFSKVKGSFVVDRDNLENSKAEGVIDVASITTSAPLRDEHLRSEKFFDAAKYPTMTFTSKSWKKSTEEPDTFAVTGDLTIRAVTKEVLLKVKSLGFGPGMQEKTVSGWELSTVLDRRDFGITAGQGPIGNKVEVLINIEAILQKPPVPKTAPLSGQAHQN